MSDITAAPSPFLPDSNIQYAWDSTSLGALKKCARYYKYTIIDGWRSRSISADLEFGTLYHSALELYDKSRVAGADHEEALDRACVLVLESGFQSDHPKKNPETLLRSVVWYLETYKNDLAETFVLADGKAAVELSFRFDTGVAASAEQNYLLSGHLDKVVTFGGDVFVLDRKTTGATLGSYYFDRYNPDNQMSLYTLASRVVFNAPVSGVIIDAAQIAVGFTAFSRGITTRSDAQLEEWMQDTFKWFETALSYAQANHWPQNEASCGNYGGCVFQRICRQDPRVREQFLATDFEVRYWNPLQTR